MSVVGEVLAVVSCVAGLIQAYDSAGRTIERIKERRRAHQAAPPSEYLAKSVERGKKQLEEAINEGTERFGAGFEKGDDAVQIALMKITIAVQAELLEGLANARVDDEIVDFSACINASDNGRKEAINVLNEYFLRKSKEEQEALAERKKNVLQNTTRQPQETEAPQTSRPSRSIRQQSAQPVAEPPSPPSPSSPEPARSRRFPWVRRTSTSIETNQPQLSRPQQTPIQRQNSFNPPLRAHTTSGNIQTVSGSAGDTRPDLPPWDTRRSMSHVHSSVPTPPSINNSNTSPSLSRRSTTYSEYSFSSPTMQSYGGGCKNAHRLRDGQTSKGLKLQLMTTFSPGATGCNYRCPSTKCSFQVAAIKNKKGDWLMDTRVRKWRGILEYRPMFLAKSHMPTQASWTEQGKQAQYICIICVLSHESTGTFQGHDALLDHVAGHWGATWCGLKLDGPLVFHNTGASTSGDFDINLLEPVPATDISSISTRDSLPVIDTDLQHELDKLELSSRRSSYTTLETETDPYYSPW